MCRKFSKNDLIFSLKHHFFNFDNASAIDSNRGVQIFPTPYKSVSNLRKVLKLMGATCTPITEDPVRYPRKLSNYTGEVKFLKRREE